MDEESSGSDYTPTYSEECITDESSDADDSDAHGFDVDDIKVLSGEENLPSEGDCEANETQTAWKPVCKSVRLFPLLGKKSYVYNLTVVPKMESPCQYILSICSLVMM